MFARCFECNEHAECFPGMLADVVVPVTYAPKGSAHARNLWLYKAGGAGSQAPAGALRELLLVFLADHGPCAWSLAAMPPPTVVDVVPSGRRPGPHPLATLVAPFLSLRWAGLRATRLGGPPWRDVDPGRFAVAAPLRGASVLLLDDTWTSGSSAQSAAVALRAAGARHVAVVVIARHIGRTAPAGVAFDARYCCLHGQRRRRA
ncbi:MAG TPA: hypothetical protein VG253_00690 [Streptosporangiaceae bacterium]|jgi:hypothetical protein|nr:hypothetical protein [Streptosporangiaceae bacterium]